MLFERYDPENGPFYDEIFKARGLPRPELERLVSVLEELGEGVLREKQRAAQCALLSLGKMRGIYYQGLTSATLSRGEAYQFGRLGRLLERADKTSRILDVKYYMLLPKPSDAGTTVRVGGHCSAPSVLCKCTASGTR